MTYATQIWNTKPAYFANVEYILIKGDLQFRLALVMYFKNDVLIF